MNDVMSVGLPLFCGHCGEPLEKSALLPVGFDRYTGQKVRGYERICPGYSSTLLGLFRTVDESHDRILVECGEDDMPEWWCYITQK